MVSDTVITTMGKRIRLVVALEERNIAWLDEQVRCRKGTNRSWIIETLIAKERNAPAPPRFEWAVYCCQCDELTKVGRSATPDARMKNLGGREIFTVLCPTKEVAALVETGIHKKLSQWLAHGREWFALPDGFTDKWKTAQPEADRLEIRHRPSVHHPERGPHKGICISLDHETLMWLDKLGDREQRSRAWLINKIVAEAKATDDDHDSANRDRAADRPAVDGGATDDAH